MCKQNYQEYSAANFSDKTLYTWLAFPGNSRLAQPVSDKFYRPISMRTRSCPLSQTGRRVSVEAISRNARTLIAMEPPRVWLTGGLNFDSLSRHSTPRHVSGHSGEIATMHATLVYPLCSGRNVFTSCLLQGGGGGQPFSLQYHGSTTGSMKYGNILVNN